MNAPIRIGFIGAGAVVQSVHLPTLARIGGPFRVAALWDRDAALAARVAETCGAADVPTLEALLAHPHIDVVAVCTPAAFHAEHVLAAMAAGKRVVLCEKPLATSLDEARAVAVAANSTGTALFVGTMHSYDPAWLAMASESAQMAPQVRLVRSSIVLPFNDRFELWACEPAASPPALPRPSPPLDDERRRRIVRSGIMELAIHDLPLVRAFVPDNSDVVVTAASAANPFSYALTVTAGDLLIDLSAHIGRHWQPRWEFEAIASEVAIHLVFAPSFVHAGSAAASIWRNGVREARPTYRGNGYEGEWRAVAALMAGASPPDPAALVQDLAFALTIADQAEALVNVESPR